MRTAFYTYTYTHTHTHARTGLEKYLQRYLRRSTDRVARYAFSIRSLCEPFEERRVFRADGTKNKEGMENGARNMLHKDLDAALS